MTVRITLQCLSVLLVLVFAYVILDYLLVCCHLLFVFVTQFELTVKITFKKFKWKVNPTHGILSSHLLLNCCFQTVYSYIEMRFQLDNFLWVLL